MGYKLNNESSMSYEDVKIIEELIERKIILTERLMRKIGISKESLLYRIQKIVQLSNICYKNSKNKNSS